MQVEIRSDLVCPWCYVGTRRFEQALERVRAEGGPDDVEAVHRAFELDPTVPPGGVDHAAYLARKFGGADRLRGANQRLDAAAEPIRGTAVALLDQGFEDLEEDFGEEQFFATARAFYWKSADGSAGRTLAAALIQQLDF